jgi:imidazoleglycerol-phosphate dehydratase
MSVIVRETRETTVRVEIVSDASRIEIATSVPFLDHMMTVLARYAGCGVVVSARGDLKHHIIEDVAIAFGTALAKSAPKFPARYGERTVPMDDALVQCVIDIGGRPYYRGRLPSTLYEHWMRSFADSARASLHVRVIRGRDRHHIVEGAFKALGFALRQALRAGDDVMSTKGVVSLEGGEGDV